MNTNLIQSCITSVSFPENLEGVLGMVEKHSDEDWITDMDILINFGKLAPQGTFWTAPRWMTQDDILFFYHTKRAKLRVSKLLKQAKNTNRIDAEFIKLLERADSYAKKYSGTIFACSPVSGTSEYFAKEPEYHFDSRTFAPINKVHVFEKPLSSDNFASLVKIGQNTLTPIYRQEFKGIKDLLSQQNDLPAFLANAVFGEMTFHKVNAENWHIISCKSETRFISESQFREYLLDYLLNELKDEKTSVLKECQCYRKGQKTGIADYFVKVYDNWIPIEAKLNVLSEKDLFSQIEKYILIDSFSPTIGNNREKLYQTATSPLCLIADQTGIYIFWKNKFSECDFGNPIWRREDLNHSTASIIRNKLKSFY